MKISIISDCHLGVKKFRQTEIDENGTVFNAYSFANNKAFVECIDKANKKSDALLVAGDFFDNPNPDVLSINTGLYIRNLDIPSYIIEGNHDLNMKMINSEISALDLIRNPQSTFPFVADFEPQVCDLDEDTVLTMVPYKITPEIWNKVRELEVGKKNYKTKILMCHGMVDYTNELDGDDPYNIPLRIAQKYDLVITGHIHIPRVVDSIKTTVLTPGSIMPSAQALEGKTAKIWYYDTKTHKLDYELIESAPKVFHDNTTNELDLKDILQDISNSNEKNINLIMHNGSSSDIPAKLFKSAWDNSIMLSVSVVEFENTQNAETEKVDLFWDYVHKEYPLYEKEFKEVIKDI